MRIPYYHVDAFTDETFSGNPAGVCLLEAFPDPRTMQKIAAENRHSETAFVVGRTGADFDLRWFTPEVEDDLCGHATLASAFVLAYRGQNIWPVRFHTCSGVLTVVSRGDEFEMDFPARPPRACEVPVGLLPALGLRRATVMRSERDYLVVVERAAEVRALAPDIAALAKLGIGIGGAIVTAPSDDADADYVVRFFPPSVGIGEDPATGSIQCTLAPYWSARLGKNELRARQLSARGGKMRAVFAGDRVKIAGAARLYLRGEIEL
ncbi:MAG TPA: PhzF family phenazine biosynthesis protein [Thermoanaerobaculia bacterium]